MPSAVAVVHVAVEQSWWAEWLPVMAATVVALLTGVYVVITWRLVKQGRDANRIAGLTLAAESEARAAAQRQSTAMIRETERTRLAASTPQITVEFKGSHATRVPPIPKQGRTVTIDLGVDGGAVFRVGMTLRVKNHGPGPATFSLAKGPDGSVLNHVEQGGRPTMPMRMTFRSSAQTVIDEGEELDLLLSIEDTAAAFAIRSDEELRVEFVSSNGITHVSDTHVLTGQLSGLSYSPQPAGGGGQTYTLDTGQPVTFDPRIAVSTRAWPDEGRTEGTPAPGPVTTD